MIARICSGLAISTARSREKLVSRIESASTSSRSSWAISSSPVASGTGRVPRLEDVDGGGLAVGRGLEDLLRAFRVVALAPTLGRVAVHHVAQAQDAVGERLGTGRA